MLRKYVSVKPRSLNTPTPLNRGDSLTELHICYYC